MDLSDWQTYVILIFCILLGLGIVYGVYCFFLWIRYPQAKPDGFCKKCYRKWICLLGCDDWYKRFKGHDDF